MLGRMSMSPRMREFLNTIPGIGRDKFQERIDSEDDEFIDEYLRQVPVGGYRRSYVSQVQEARRHKQFVKSIGQKDADRWYKKPAGIILIGVATAVIVMIVKYTLGL